MPFSAPQKREAVKIFTGSALPDSGIGLAVVEDTIVGFTRCFIRARRDDTEHTNRE